MKEIGLEWLVIDDAITFKEQSASPGTPNSNKLKIYAKDKSSVSNLYWKNDAGVEFDLSVGGTVTSVAQTFTGGLISVSGSPVTGNGTLALTVAGTSGGIPYFSSSSTWASSGALTANLPVIGGGAGAAPTVGTRSGTTTQFGTVTGTKTVLEQLAFDANGNIVASGTAIGSAATIGIGSTVTSGTTGAVLFIKAGPILGQDGSDFIWDTANKWLGIGTTTPRTAIDVRSGDITVGNFVEPANAGRGIYVGRNSGAAEFAGFCAGVAGQSVIFRGYLAGGTISSPTATTTDQALGMALNGYTAAATVDSTASARIRLAAGENWSSTAEGSYIAFDTTALTVTSGSRAERFRVGPSGQWGIGGATYGTAGQFFRSGGASAAPTWAAPDHGAEVGGLGDDDHTQYALLAGRSGGQSLKGGTAAADGLSLIATAGVGVGSELISFKLGSNGANIYAQLATTSFILDSCAASTDYALNFKDNGTSKWKILKNTANLLSIYDSVNSASLMTFRANTTPSDVLVDITPISISTTTANIAAFAVRPTFTSSGDGPQGFGISPTFTPSANITLAYGFLSYPNFNPASSKTISTAIGAYLRADTTNGAGAVTTIFGAYCASPIYGSLKPTTNYGLAVVNQGVAGVTNTVGLQVNAQTGSTNNWDMGFGTVDNTAAGAYYGRIPVLYNGLTKYIHVFSA
jgi:hypothetical protein